MKQNYSKGVTLVELLIAMAIIGILATIAIPSYSQYTIRSSREAAQSELLQLAAVQEKIYLNINSYATSLTAAYNTGGLGSTGQTSDGKYTITIDLTGAQTYTLSAKPVAGGKQVGNGCLTIQENGARLWYTADDGCAVAPTVPW